MRIVVISDTHTRHEALGDLRGDVLIHCGDLFDLDPDLRRPDEISGMDAWFGRQRFDLVLCTGGNHDLGLERRLRTDPQPFANAVFLKDRTVEHGGLVFHGAPWTPFLEGHAFYRDEEGMEDAWARIPAETDVLITHTPPLGILDRAGFGARLGCPALRDAVKRIAPRLHCFGHVHAGAGSAKSGATTFVNASSVDLKRGKVHPPFVFDL